jgi:hypothetical protein
MCLSGGPGSLDLTADERFWRDEQSCVIVRDKLLKECSCVPFAPGSNAGAVVTVPTNDSTPVVPRDKIEDKHDEAKKEKHRQNDEAKKEKHRQNDEAKKEKHRHNDEAKNEKHRHNDEAKNEKHRRHREQQVPVEARYQEDRAIQRYREQQVPVEAQRYQEDRGFGGSSWSNRQY